MKISKTYLQVFIILFVILSLFTIKDDLIDFFRKTFLSSDKKTQVINNNFVVEDIVNIPQKVEDPSTLSIFDIIDTGISKNEVYLKRENIIEQTNIQRMNNGNLTPLVENSKLNFSAEKKLQDMFVKQYFDHKSPSGLGVSDLGDQVSYEYISMGENLAMGNFKDTESLVNSWMASDGHRANILNKNYMEIGVAIGKGIYKDKEVWMVVQHFGLPRDICPPIDSILRETIYYNEEQIKKYESELTLLLNNINNRVVYNGMTTNEQIRSYNGKVIIYNELVEKTKLKITEYNEQVNVFNACLLENSK